VRRAGQILPAAIGRDEVLRTARAQAVLRDWTAIVGESLAERSQPDRYGKGAVWVAVEGSAWAQELRMRKDVILGRLRERSGDPTLFTDIRFGVRPLPKPMVEEVIAIPEPEPDVPVEYLSIREIARRRLAKMRQTPSE